jgi:hypothetical protein
MLPINRVFINHQFTASIVPPGKSRSAAWAARGLVFTFAAEFRQQQSSRAQYTAATDFLLVERSKLKCEVPQPTALVYSG